jgi:uncharacterized protein
MSLKKRLLADLKQAMKDKEAIKKSSITMARAAILQVEKDKKIELDDPGVIEIIAKQVKQLKDSRMEFEKADRTDLIEKNQKEIEILSQYLPEQLSENEVDRIVIETINEVDAGSMKDMGKVMSAIMPKVKGKADGSIVNKLVKKHLQK